MGRATKRFSIALPRGREKKTKVRVLRNNEKGVVRRSSVERKKEGDSSRKKTKRPLRRPSKDYNRLSPFVNRRNRAKKVPEAS